ncbi:hypothetical protein CFter6_3810 [Collimonas fungivorans]|uniref:Lipoprotein n=1 Tax=Collimonas fungivorans TaxID=158899 RepID=A0A127PF39_9BURK|nr:hypothetical protein CFter6_3810 [Collimonas fungivorans]
MERRQGKIGFLATLSCFGGRPLQPATNSSQAIAPSHTGIREI